MADPTWILIHGGCHGAWCWETVLDHLRGSGHRAIAFDLPGCGEDRTPRAEVGLDQQVTTAIAQVDAVDPGPVRLVGHSIAGWVLPAVAAARPARVTQLVFLAASVLSRGERGIDVTPPERRPRYFELAAESGENSLTVSFDEARTRFFNHLDDDRAAAAYRRLTPQPFKPYTDPAAVGIESVRVERRYLAVDDDRTYPPAATRRFAAKAGVSPEVIPGDHSVMLSAPESLTRALLRRSAATANR